MVTVRNMRDLTQPIVSLSFRDARLFFSLPLRSRCRYSSNSEALFGYRYEES